MAAVGSLLVRIGADVGGLRRGGRHAESAMQRMARQARHTATRMARLGAAAAAAGAAIATHLTRRGLESIDAQAKLARQLGTTADELRGLQISASDAGITSQQLEKNMTALNRRLGQAANGTGEAQRALEQLGIDARELINLPMAERMAVIGDAINDVGTSAERSAIAADLMSRQGIQMLNMFEGGGDAIRGAREEVDQFGLSLSDVDSAQVERANDAMSRIGRAVEAVSQRLAIEFAPILEGIAKHFNDIQKETDAVETSVSRFVDISVKGFGFAADASHGFRVALAGLNAVAAGFSAVFWSVIQGVTSGITSVIDHINSVVNVAISGMNRIPGIDLQLISTAQESEFQTRVEAIAQGARDRIDETNQHLNEILMEPLPSEGIRAWVEESRRLSQQGAEQMIEDRRAQAEREAEIQEEQTEQKLESDRERYAREQEEMRHHQERLGAIVAEGEADRNQEIGRFAQANQAIRENSIRSETAALRSGLQTMFGEHKAFGEALGVLKRLEAIQSAYAWGASIGGPIAGAAAAATAAAAQMSTLDAVKSTSFKGGSSQPSAGSTSAPAMDQGGSGGGQQRQGTTINLHGDSFGRRQVREMLEQMNEDGVDGGGIRVVG